MFDLTNVKLKQISLHKVGNKTQEEPLELSDLELEIEEHSMLHKAIMQYFLKPFKEGAMYHFDDESGDLNLNEVFGYARRLFQNPFEEFMLQSKNIAKHLYKTSTHPRIKGGELYVALLQDCIVDGEVVDAIGLFKAEHKDKFLKVGEKNDVGAFPLVQEEGVSIKKLDKGCLIFLNEEEKGYKVLLKDSPTKSIEALYWKESFLCLKPREDSYYHTKNYLDICKTFVQEVFNEENNVQKPAQLDLLNRSLNYFQEKDAYNRVEFENEVLEEADVVDAFKEYKVDYSEKMEIPFYEEFNINQSAVKKSKKDFKGVIKLDQKIQITVTGNEHNIEKGFDEEKDMNYYVVFYNEEESK